jgi:hypothetical protein
VGHFPSDADGDGEEPKGALVMQPLMLTIFMRCKLTRFIVGMGAFCVALFCAMANAQTITTYPSPSGITPSNVYSVSVNGISSFTYKSNAKRTGAGTSLSYTDFAFSGGPVTVSVTRLGGANPINSVILRPLNLGLTATIESDNTVSFTVTQPCKISVEFDGDTSDKLFVFADAPEVNPPHQGDAKVIYYGPGVYDIGKNVSIPNGNTVYLAGGAYVKGTFSTSNGSNVAIKGRGVLSGEKFAHVDGPGNILFQNCNNVTVDGIISVDSPGYHVSCFYNKTPGSTYQNTFNNIKVMGWLDNTDGIHPQGNSTVNDFFYFGHDDAIDIGQNMVALTVTNCTIWNFWGSSLLFSWNSHYASHVFVDNINVIHYDLKGSWNGTAVIYMIHGEPGALHNFIIQNVRVESFGGTNNRFLGLQLMKTQYSNAKSAYGSLDNVYFKNIQIDGATARNFINGYDDMHQITNVKFNNLKVNGKVCSKLPDANITANSYTANIGFAP